MLPKKRSGYITNEGLVVRETNQVNKRIRMSSDTKQQPAINSIQAPVVEHPSNPIFQSSRRIVVENKLDRHSQN